MPLDKAVSYKGEGSILFAFMPEFGGDNTLSSIPPCPRLKAGTMYVSTRACVCAHARAHTQRAVTMLSPRGVSPWVLGLLYSPS